MRFRFFSLSFPSPLFDLVNTVKAYCYILGGAYVQMHCVYNVMERKRGRETRKGTKGRKEKERKERKGIKEGRKRKGKERKKGKKKKGRNEEGRKESRKE